MKGILSHFDLLPGVILSYRFLFFSSPPLPTIVYRTGPGACEANRAPPKPLVVDLTSFH